MKYYLICSMLIGSLASAADKNPPPAVIEQDKVTIENLGEFLTVDYKDSDIEVVKFRPEQENLGVTFKDGTTLFVGLNSQQAGKKIEFVGIWYLKDGTRVQQLELVNRLNSELALGTYSLESMPTDNPENPAIPCIRAQYNLLVLSSLSTRQFVNSLRLFWLCFKAAPTAKYDKENLILVLKK